MLYQLAVMAAESFGFFEFLTGAAIVGAVIVLVFIAYAASRPADNPLRQVAGLLAMRLGVTLGVGMVDLPVSIVAPPLGGLMDVASYLGLAGYWIYGFIKAGRAFMPPKAPAVAAAPAPPLLQAQPQPQIVYVTQPPPYEHQAAPALPHAYERQPYYPPPSSAA